MANKSKVQSVEPDIADLVNGWLKSYGLDYKLEQASLNSEIDKALDEYHSKIGGKGGNRPDAKLLLKDKYGTFYPVLIEYKGYKDKLVKLDTDGIVDNKKDKNEPNYTNIKSYAVNGAIHYANAILHYTSYTRIIAIGVTGYKDEFGKLQHEIGVYYVSADKNNLGFGQRVGDYTDLSFLKPSHFDEFVEKLNELSLTQAEIDKLKEKREKEINTKNGKIDFEFMESFIEELEAERIEELEAERIEELEAERIEELEAYLSVSGLKDTQLTADELSAVNDLISKNIEFKPFCYDVIFDKIVQGRRLKKDDQIAGDIPFVMAGVTNTGVVGYISNPVASFPKNSITIDIFGNAFYRNYDFGAGDDTGVYWSEKSDYSKEIMLFLTCSMGKSIENKFSYGKKLRSSQSFKFKMQLPVKNEQPDYELMSTLISAIQKLVIADVVKFSDEKIKATKQVVG